MPTVSCPEEHLLSLSKTKDTFAPAPILSLLPMQLLGTSHLALLKSQQMFSSSIILSQSSSMLLHVSVPGVPGVQAGDQEPELHVCTTVP